MITCPSCQTTNVDNTVFCDECGAALIASAAVPAIAFDAAATQHLQEAIEKKKQQLGLSAPLASHTVRLIVNHQRQIDLKLDKVHYLGRKDPSSNSPLEVDLTAEDTDRFISRRHARILIREGNIVIQDLASSNGTFVNGQRLTPYIFENLRNGDDLELGRLKIEIRIQEG